MACRSAPSALRTAALLERAQELLVFAVLAALFGLRAGSIFAKGFINERTKRDSGRHPRRLAGCASQRRGASGDQCSLPADGLHSDGRRMQGDADSVGSRSFPWRAPGWHGHGVLRERDAAFGSPPVAALFSPGGQRLGAAFTTASPAHEPALQVARPDSTRQGSSRRRSQPAWQRHSPVLSDDGFQQSGARAGCSL